MKSPLISTVLALGLTTGCENDTNHPTGVTESQPLVTSTQVDTPAHDRSLHLIIGDMVEGIIRGVANKMREPSERLYYEAAKRMIRAKTRVINDTLGKEKFTEKELKDIFIICYLLERYTIGEQDFFMLLDILCYPERYGAEVIVLPMLSLLRDRCPQHLKAYKSMHPDRYAIVTNHLIPLTKKNTENQQ